MFASKNIPSKLRYDLTVNATRIIFFFFFFFFFFLFSLNPGLLAPKYALYQTEKPSRTLGFQLFFFLFF